ncbi:tyrosine-type recombinase/integrase [Nocardioides hankookensis]
MNSWATWLRAANRSPDTIDLRTYQVRRVMRDIDVDPWSLTTEQLVVYLGSQSWQASTKRTYRASLRAFYAWAQATGRRADNPAALTPEITVPKKLPRPVPEAVLRDAIAAADDRVRLMLLLAATCGLRRGELARARLEDIVADLAGFSLVVHGKGRKQRLVPLPDGLAAVLRQLPPGYLFTSRAWGRAGAPLSPARVGELVSEVLPPGWTCHTLRHRCATVAYAATKDLRAVQELLGHSKPETTMVYTLIHEDSVRAAMTAATTFGDVA